MIGRYGPKGQKNLSPSCQKHQNRVRLGTELADSQCSTLCLFSYDSRRSVGEKFRGHYVFLGDSGAPLVFVGVKNAFFVSGHADHQRRNKYFRKWNKCIKGTSNDGLHYPLGNGSLLIYCSSRQWE